MKKIFALALTGALMSSAFAADQCKAVVEAKDDMTFNVKQITIDKAACPKFTIELKNTGSLPAAAMGHDVVVSKTGDMEGVLEDGGAAGLEHDYLKEGDKRVLAHTKVIGGGESDSVTFPTAAFKAGDDYTFFCSFPGHYASMNGKVVVK